jgi:hypothetical protein
MLHNAMGSIAMITIIIGCGENHKMMSNIEQTIKLTINDDILLLLVDGFKPST